MMYTYQDFLTKAQESGHTFSDADLALAKRNPDAGMSILQYKNDYRNAKTDAERKAANDGAESIRLKEGGYTGGAYGNGFYADSRTPSSFQREELPTYQSEYKKRADEILDAISNQQPFSYDYTQDDAWKSYKKAYAREGQRATENAMGVAASMTGGIPSSYAMTAGAQAGNYYAAQAADKIPQLYDAAYNRYIQEFQNKRSALSDIMAADQLAFQKYQDAADRKERETNFDYQQFMDDITYIDSRRKDEWNQALAAAETGDFRALEAMGVDTTELAYQKALGHAKDGAEVGDYGGYQNVGINAKNAVEQLKINLDEKVKSMERTESVDKYNALISLANLAMERKDYNQAQIYMAEAAKAVGINLADIGTAGGMSVQNGSGGVGKNSVSTTNQDGINTGNPTGKPLDYSAYEFEKQLIKDAKTPEEKEAIRMIIGEDMYHKLG